jgi:hypothetical protein
MRRPPWWCLFLCVLIAQPALAQVVVRQDENLGGDRPEAWAMKRVAGASLMTAFGEIPALDAGQWSLALDAGNVPRLSRTEQRVGFNGEKLEDLNKSPVFGRLHLRVGLPAGWVAEFGYTPPLAINGARPRDMVAAAIGRRLLQRGAFSLSARAFGQHGGIAGDITCPQALAGVADFERNPYGCQAASDDRIDVNDYGIDVVGGWDRGPWHWHADGGIVRTELQVQVDALTFDTRDRSRLVANGYIRYVAIGVRRSVGDHWSVGGEVLHVPLDVRRRPGEGTRGAPLTSLRVQLRYDY